MIALAAFSVSNLIKTALDVLHFLFLLTTPLDRAGRRRQPFHPVPDAGTGFNLLAQYLIYGIVKLVLSEMLIGVLGVVSVAMWANVGQPIGGLVPVGIGDATVGPAAIRAEDDTSQEKVSLLVPFVTGHGIQGAAFHACGVVSTPMTARIINYPHGGTRTTAQRNPTSVFPMMFETEPSGDAHSPKPREVMFLG